MVLLSFGWMLEQSDRIGEARAIYHHSLRVNPWLKYRAYFRSSALRASLGSEDRLDDYLSGADVLLWYGWEAFRKGDLAIAAANFRKAREMNPLHSGPMVGLAEINLMMGDEESAFRHAQHALFLGSSTSWAGFRLSMAGTPNPWWRWASPSMKSIGIRFQCNITLDLSPYAAILNLVPVERRPTGNVAGRLGGSGRAVSSRSRDGRHRRRA